MRKCEPDCRPADVVRGAGMEEYDIIFAADVAALGNVRSCRVRSLSAEASAVLLLSREHECLPLLLGRPHVVDPGFRAAVTADERTKLGLLPAGEEEGVDVFCRICIPDDDPLSAGFDLSRLILTAPAPGRALEVVRPGGRIVPLRKRADASSEQKRGN